MKTPARLLTIALLAALVSPAAHAGSLADPEIVDDNDEVAVSGPLGPICSGGPAGGCPGFDFMWRDTDINSAFVNETADSLTFTLEMKFSPSFGAGSGGFFIGPSAMDDTCSYVVNFLVRGVAYTASAAVAADGTPTVGGVATVAETHDGNQMTWTVPKAAVGAQSGDVVSGLYVTAHCETELGLILDDRAPDANTGRDYLVGGASVSAKPVFVTLTNATASVAYKATAPTSGVTQYNWTKGPATGTLAFKAVVGAGMLNLTVLDAKNATVYQKMIMGNSTTAASFSGKAAGAWRIVVAATGFKGNLTLAIASSTPAPNGSGTGASSATGSANDSGSATTSKKGTPAPFVPIALVALAAMALLRRRLV